MPWRPVACHHDEVPETAFVCSGCWQARCGGGANRFGTFRGSRRTLKKCAMSACYALASHSTQSLLLFLLRDHLACHLLRWVTNHDKQTMENRERTMQV